VTGRISGAVVAGALAIVGCGGNSASSTTSNVPGAGQGIAHGLRAAGLQLCTGPISGRSVIASYNGQPVPVSLEVYATRGFAAVVATGQGAREHSIGVVERHFNTAGAPPAAQLAATEHAWRREAQRSLRAPGVPHGPCSSEAPRLPELAPLQVVCTDQLLIPLGRGSAADTYASVMGKLVYLAGHPSSVHYDYNMYGGGTYTSPSTIHQERPYCPSS
jgi:hypothetical protein